MKRYISQRLRGAVAFGVLLLLSLSCFAQEMRTWTDTQGRTVEAAFVSASSDGVVRFKLGKTGRMSETTMAKLSQADRDYIQSQTSAGARGNAVFDATGGFVKRMANRFSGMTTTEKKRFGIMAVVVAVVNIPVFFLLWVPMFFKNFSGLWQGIMFNLQPEVVSAMRGELGHDIWAEIKLGFLILWSLLTVFAQIVAVFAFFFL
jgi:hypothetical protein